MNGSVGNWQTTLA